MGLQIAEIVPKKEISLDDLSGKVIAVDSFNILYQFLANIRQPDGTPLMDSKGRVTSHLSGLFYRTINLLVRNIKPAFVFDGKPPELKEREKDGRRELKKRARTRYEEARKRGVKEEMFKYSRQMLTLNDEMIEESKKLLKALGLPVVQAPSEGEAQCAFITKKGDAYATASQDYDALLFGTARLVQNLTLAKRRRLASGSFVSISPQIIELNRVLNSLQLSQDQLICLGILTGTDFNPGGVKGLGPKKSLQIVRQYKEPILIFRHLKENQLDFDWKEIFALFKKPRVSVSYKIKFNKLSEAALKKILCKEHEFSEERVDNAIKKLEEASRKASQKKLEKWY